MASMNRVQRSSRTLVGLACAALSVAAALFNPSVSASSKPAAQVPETIQVPFRLFNNHIYVRVRVNGSRPLWFLLDSGAVNLIAYKHARALGLQLNPAGQATGVGDGSLGAFTTQNVSFALQGVTFIDRKSAVLNVDGLERCVNEVDADVEGQITRRPQTGSGEVRQAFDGILGDEFFRRFVVDIDYAKRLLALHDPTTFKYRGHGAIVPLEVRDRYVFARGSVAATAGYNAAGLFLIDTGFMSAVALHRPFIADNGLMPPIRNTAPFEICGIGGGSKSRIGKLASLRLAGISAQSPVTLFSEANSGNFARSDYDGEIGNAVLRRYHVVFDYPRSRLILD